MVDPIRVVVADRQPVRREGLRAVLAREPQFALVGEAADGREALRLTLALSPHVLLLDVHLRGPSAYEVMSRLHRSGRPVGVLAVAGVDGECALQPLLAAGLTGCILGDEEPELLLAAVRAVARGDPWFSPRLIGLLAHRHGRQAPPAAVGLSDRELQVVSLVARGWRERAIAEALSIGERTVREDLRRARMRLGVDSRAALIAWAAKRGLDGEFPEGKDHTPVKP